MAQRFDAMIIGAGQAGPSLATRLAKAGRRVALVERHLLGGTCVNTGCTPTKALVASAHAAHIARRSADFGVMTGQVSVNMSGVKARMDAIVTKSRSGLEKWLGGTPNCTVIRGQAKFIGQHAMRIGEADYEAEQIFLNVGARPAVPNMPGVDSVPFLTSTSILALDELPDHLVVVGGGYVGLEFAQIFRRFGSKVTIVEKAARLASHEDEDASKVIQEIFAGEGIDVRLKA